MDLHCNPTYVYSVNPSKCNQITFWYVQDCSAKHIRKQIYVFFVSPENVFDYVSLP